MINCIIIILHISFVIIFANLLIPLFRIILGVLHFLSNSHLHHFTEYLLVLSLSNFLKLVQYNYCYCCYYYFNIFYYLSFSYLLHPELHLLIFSFYKTILSLLQYFSLSHKFTLYQSFLISRRISGFFLSINNVT